MSKRLDRRQKIEIIITIVGVIFLIYLVARNVHIACVKKVSRDKQSMSSTSPAVTLQQKGRSGHRTAQLWGKDPFYPEKSPSSDTSVLEGFSLTGVVWDAENPYAIINNEIIKVGDKLNGATVIQINKKSVLLRKDGTEYTLKLDIL